ncbi:tyrosine recombinase XerC [Paenibacillus sp. J45TS6]|uniref:Tyrosine-type recombinase/integrase n=1 Tax=Paenibacillus gallinarum TaxID=2762232 RepID=A0ABR8T6G5_9BACL|nr:MULTISPECIES: tyrosine-type recombinase/integrase [Paenibacillus]MBD7971364.1 tyrosine-type recombinase/integrase [Paenibacillus gallinarum]GIP45171.1 tyrosine recombinase XerC [Paenibacillus sp. J45TS6]
MSTMFGLFENHLRKSGVSERTILNYLSTWNKFENWIKGTDPDLSDAGTATQKDIADYKRYMLLSGGRGGQPAKPSTMQLTFVHLNAIFRFFADQGLIQDNPVGPIKKPPAARRSPKWLTRNEQNALLREVRGQNSKRDYAIVLLMLRAGLRVHELCDLQKKEVIMSVRSGSAYVRGKGDKDREVPLNNEVRSALQSYFDDRDDTSPYVFVSQRSKQLSVRGVQHMIENYRSRTRIDHLTCHALRHTFGHDLISAGNDLQQVAMLMGHFKKDGTPNIQMTMIYTTPGMEDLTSAVESISWT